MVWSLCHPTSDWVHGSESEFLFLCSLFFFTSRCPINPYELLNIPPDMLYLLFVVPDELFLLPSSCWLSSDNNLIWIFVSFVVMIEVVSKTNFK